MASKRRVCWKADSELEEVKIFSDSEGPPAKKPFIGLENPFEGVSNGKLENHSTHSQDEVLKALHKSSSDESVIESPPGDDDAHSKTSTKIPESIIKRRLCPHRQYGCLFETTTEESNSLEEHLHSEPGCIFEKFKFVIQNKENQVLDLKQQLKQMKIDMMLRIHSLEQQLFLLSSNTMQLATKFQMQENQRQQTHIRTESKPLPIDPKYTRNPFKLNAQLVCTLEGHKQIVTSLVTNDFTMFTGSGDATQQGSLKKWNLTSFAIQDSTDDGVVFSLIIHESKLICGSMNHIKIRDVETLEVFSRLEGHRGEVKSLIVAGARLISGAVDGFVKVWDLDNYQCLLSVKAHDSQVIGIEASIVDQQLEYLFTASHDSTIKMWSQTFQLIHTFKGHVGPIKSLVRIDQFLISGAEDNLIKIWDWSKRDEIETLSGLPGVTALKSGKLNGIDIFFSGHVNGAILIWDFKSRELLQYIEAHKDRVRAITGFQQLLITASYDKTIKIWQ